MAIAYHNETSERLNAHVVIVFIYYRIERCIVLATTIVLLLLYKVVLLIVLLIIVENSILFSRLGKFTLPRRREPASQPAASQIRAGGCADLSRRRVDSLEMSSTEDKRSISLGVFGVAVLSGTLGAAIGLLSRTMHDQEPKPAIAPSTEPAPLVKSRKSIVRKLYREVWNNVDLDSAEKSASKFVSEDHVLIDPSNPNPVPGTEAYMESVRGNREALPDYVITIDDLIEEGSKVVAQLSFKASLNEREARWTGTCVMEFDEKEIVRTWINTDAMSALIQLGLMTDLVNDGNVKLRPVTQALMGRSEAHPETVLTGKDWLQYFEQVHESWERNSTADGDNAAALKHDSNTGLDVVV